MTVEGLLLCRGKESQAAAGRPYAHLGVGGCLEESPDFTEQGAG